MFENVTQDKTETRLGYNLEGINNNVQHFSVKYKIVQIFLYTYIIIYLLAI